MDDLRRGAHVVAGDDNPDAIAIATGSEVHLAVAARKALAGERNEAERRLGTLPRALRARGGRLPRACAAARRAGGLDRGRTHRPVDVLDRP